jgi:hypothetical protein
MDSIVLWKMFGLIVVIIGIVIPAYVDHLKDKEEFIQKEQAIKERNEAREDARTKGEQLKEISRNTQEIKNQLEPFLQIAIQKYPSETPDKALENLSHEVSRLSSELITEKNTIKSLGAEVYIKYSGNWKTPDGKASGANYYAGSHKPYLKLIDKSGKHKDIEFCIDFAIRQGGTFENKLLVQLGELPHGELINYMAHYDRIEAWLAFPKWEIPSDGKITFDDLNIRFVINGSRKFEYKLDKPYPVTKFQHITDPLEQNMAKPTFILDKNIFQIEASKND